MNGPTLDDFTEVSGWSTGASGQARLDIAGDRRPAGGGPMRQVGAIELAIAAPPGGKGTVWIANLGLEDHSFRSIPAVQASSALPGHEARFAVDRRAETSWRSASSDESQWFMVDF